MQQLAGFSPVRVCMAEMELRTLYGLVRPNLIGLVVFRFLALERTSTQGYLLRFGHIMDE